MKRFCMGAALALFFFALMPLAAGQALAQPDARQTLEKAIGSVLAILRDPAYAHPAMRGVLRQRIENEVRGSFDFGEFSSRTVGPAWRKFSPQEKESFEAAFSDLLFNTYLNRIHAYSGESVEYTGEKVAPDGSRAEIMTLLRMKDGKTTPVAYRMLPKDGSWKVYDVIIENVSLVKNYRTQFQTILNGASPEKLINLVREKAAQALAQPEGANGR